MKSINELFTENYSIPEEAYTQLKTQVIRQIEPMLLARTLMPIKKVPPTVETVTYDLEAGISDAQVISKGGEFPRDLPSISRITHNIVKMGKGYAISREDFIKGDIINRSVHLCTRKVAEFENNLLFFGDSDYNILGIDDVYGNTFGASNVWDSGSEDPYGDVNKLLATLELDSFGLNPARLTLILHPTNVGEARKRDTYGNVILKQIKELVPRVIACPQIVEGSGYLMDSGPDLYEYVVAEDVTVERASYRTENQSYIGNVYVRGVPRFFQYGSVANKTDAIAKLTGI